MIKRVIICDGCGKEKGATNHWFTQRSFPERSSFTAFSKGIDSNERRHFCSQGCVLAAFQQWMDTEIKGNGE